MKKNESDASETAKYGSYFETREGGVLTLMVIGSMRRRDTFLEGFEDRRCMGCMRHTGRGLTPSSLAEE